MKHEHEHEIEFRNWRFEVDYDQWSESPRSWDNIGYLITHESRYVGGYDEQVPEGEEVVLTLPVYLYVHSGATISTAPFSCRWDSGQWGVIVATKERCREILGWDEITPERKEKLKTYLEGEIDILDTYIRGEVYSVTTYKDGDVYDSCCGFLGDEWKDYVLELYHDPQLTFDWCEDPREQLKGLLAAC